MDSLTQLALGATVGAACAPKQHRRSAAIVGGILGTLPDLDVLISYQDPVDNFTRHRGFSHSLLVLVPAAFFLWLLACQIFDGVRTQRLRWFLVIALSLVTHPILDAHTIYGTQLFWPIVAPPLMWSTIFIIDPLYSIPLFISTIYVLLKPRGQSGNTVVACGLIISSIYLLWSWYAKSIVDYEARREISSLDIQSPVFFSVPTPFNTLAWRVVVMDGDQYLEGYYSFLNSDNGIKFASFPSGDHFYGELTQSESLNRLRWFSHGFLELRKIDGKLVASDIRMGAAPDYVFRFVLAKDRDAGLVPIPPERLRTPYTWDRVRKVFDRI